MMGIPFMPIARDLPEGVDFADIITSLKGGVFAGVLLSNTERVQFPLPNEDVFDIPEPGLLLGIRCENDLFHKTLLTFIRETLERPLTQQSVQGTDLHSFSMPRPMPFPVQPAIAFHMDTLLIASLPDILERALTGYAKGGDLLTSPVFQEAGGPVPEMFNGFIFLGPASYRFLENYSSKMLTGDMGPESIVELNKELDRIPSRRKDNFLSSYAIRDGDGILWVTRARTAYDHPWAPSLAREATIFAAIARDQARRMKEMMEQRRKEMQEWEQ